MKKRKSAPYSYYGAKKKPFYKNGWFYVSVVLLIALIVSELSKYQIILQEKGAQEESVKIDRKEKKTLFSRKAKKVGEFEFVVNDSYETDKIGENELFEYEANDGKFIVLNLSIKNISDEEEKISVSNFKLDYENKIYSPRDDLDYTSDEYLDSDSLNPGIQLKRNIVFEVPEKVTIKKSKLQIKLDDEKKGFLKTI